MLNKGLKPVLYDKDKAVSPIIATILLVAITVILASTLYLALGGFFSHVGTTTPSASISVSGNSTSGTSPTFTTTYSVTVGGPSAPVAWSSTGFSVTLSDGKSGSLTYNAGSTSTSPTTSTTWIGTIGTNSVTITASSDLSGNAVTQTFSISIVTSGSATSAVYLTSISYVDTASSGGGVMGTTSTIG